jgi:hypothetical protein
MAVLLWCVRCGEEAVITSEVPTRCPSAACQKETRPATWTAHLPYKVNDSDQKFLARIHVKHGKTD